MSDNGSFPEGFLWGSATSAHQIEGNNIHNDWWAWEQKGAVKEKSGLACDHYNRFRDDFDMAASLGHTVHRFSIEWSRVEPEEGHWNEEALRHYREVVDELRKRNLEPIVTLHHFTTPEWLAREGSWANPKVVDRFAKFTEKIVELLGDSVRYWITINEPMVYVYMHYVDGIGPPGGRDFGLAKEVIPNVIRAHAAAYRIIHDRAKPQNGPVQVTVAKALPWFRACRTGWPLDHFAAHMTDRIFNMAYLDAVMEGKWSVPGIGTWRFPEAKGTMDMLGVNFYTRHFIRWQFKPGQWIGEYCGGKHHPHQIRERSYMGWEVHPESFYNVLMRCKQFGIPIFVTENGTAMENDAKRWLFIRRHLQSLSRAIKDGAPILGYCYWSLMDNFEWGDGYGPRFGLVEIDYKTQERRVRDSAHRYAKICKTNRLDTSAESDTK